MTTLSTGVGLRMVTPINPRAIVMRDGTADFEVLSFARGEPLVELIARRSGHADDAVLCRAIPPAVRIQPGRMQLRPTC